MPLMHGVGAARFVNDITTPELAAATYSLMCYASKHGNPAAATALQQQEGELLGIMQEQQQQGAVGRMKEVKGLNNVVMWYGGNGNGGGKKTGWVAGEEQQVV